MEQSFDIGKIRGYIARNNWRWAKTYLDVPHEYIPKNKCLLAESEFVAFVDNILKHGTWLWWGKYHQPYLFVDGYKYWACKNAHDVYIVINRQKVFDEFSSIGEIKPYYTEKQGLIVAGAIHQFGDISVWDIGCATGALINQLEITPKLYYGCDPCKAYIGKFRETHQGFYQRVSCKAFEEMCTKWKEFRGMFVATFGAASYIMKPYLKMIPKTGNQYFLMFYKDDWVPEQFRPMHHFHYHIHDLKEMFPNAIITPTKEYYVVSSQAIDWNKALRVPNKQLNLFV